MARSIVAAAELGFGELKISAIVYFPFSVFFFIYAHRLRDEAFVLLKKNRRNLGCIPAIFRLYFFGFKLVRNWDSWGCYVCA